MVRDFISRTGQGKLWHVLGHVFLLGFTLCCQAQYIPSEFEEGDTIAIEFSYGPATIGPEITIEHNFSEDGFSIDPASKVIIDTVNSPFGIGTTLETSYYIDHVNERISVTLKRLDGETVFVDGVLCMAGGIGVLIDDVHPRTRQVISASQKKDIQVFPNPSSHFIQIACPLDSKAEVRLISLVGIQVMKWNLSTPDVPQKLSLAGINPGIYMVQVVQGHHQFAQRLVVR